MLGVVVALVGSESVEGVVGHVEGLGSGKTAFGEEGCLVMWKRCRKPDCSEAQRKEVVEGDARGGGKKHRTSVT